MYEAVAAIFIAQMNGITLSMGQVVTVRCAGYSFLSKPKPKPKPKSQIVTKSHSCIGPKFCSYFEGTFANKWKI